MNEFVVLCVLTQLSNKYIVDMLPASLGGAHQTTQLFQWNIDCCTQQLFVQPSITPSLVQLTHVIAMEDS